MQDNGQEIIKTNSIARKFVWWAVLGSNQRPIDYSTTTVSRPCHSKVCSPDYTIAISKSC